MFSTYAMFAMFALLSFIFVDRSITETRGKELEDMPTHTRHRAKLANRRPTMAR